MAGGSSSPSGGPNWNRRDYLLNQINNSKLKNLVDQLYRPGVSIGDGGTAGILRHEFDTGQVLRHLDKAQTRITNLQRIIEREALSEQERRIAYQLLNDLYDGVKYVTK